ncbi:MAG: phosphatase PAP2 family protein [Vicingaceae bacterium]|nr:phosphatase PAP2 family protein [Vicingaceae bacterium]
MLFLFVTFVYNKFKPILDFIIDIDTNLFLFFNGINNSFWDSFFYVVTGRVFWIPFVLGLLFLAYLRVGWKVVYVFLFMGVAMGLADVVSVKLFKEVFERLRPCHNPIITDLVHTVNGHCGGQFGFVSSHATNSFSLAVFVGLLFKKKFRFVMPVMLFWAVLVSYSRIYVGVHFPLDVFCGGMLGAIIACLVYQVFLFSNQKFNLKLEEL